MENITEEILNYLGNTHTKVEKKEGFMGNYYSHLIDTIYISENFENKEVPNDAKNINKKAAELITVCHECVHSMQSKYMHLLNTIFANTSIILAIICVIIGLFWASPLWLKITTSIVILISIVIRLILETGAVNGSVSLAREVTEKGIVSDIAVDDIEESTKYINKHKFLALIQMITDKIIFLILVIIIK